MTNEPIAKDDSFYEHFEEVLDHFELAMVALQLQDLQSSEQAYFNAKLIYSNTLPSSIPEENEYLKLIVYIINAASLFLRANFYLADERYTRSLEEFADCKKLCLEASEIFKKIPPSFIEEDEYGLFGLLRFQFAFLQHIVSVSEKIVKKTIEYNEGKYVDQADIFKEASKDLRNFDFQNYDTGSDIVNKWITGAVSLLNRMADNYEKRGERLEEKKKIIEFIKPIDKQVFIVHGHGEGVLRELKEMLEDNFHITPIILRDELDFGKTIIEKFEHYGRLCAFVFVVVTPDDIAENKKKKVFQARPNVLFELGWFCGRLGRSKVRIIRQKNTSMPSDLDGIVTIDFNDKVEEVYRRIQKELKAINLLSS